MACINACVNIGGTTSVSSVWMISGYEQNKPINYIYAS
jgi:hypothetical protein